MTDSTSTQIPFMRSESHALYDTDYEMKARHKNGEVLRLQYGIYADSEDWNQLGTNEQYRQKVVQGWKKRRTEDAIVSHLSAAAMWSLPLPTSVPKKLHLSGYSKHRGRSNDNVIRHSISVPDRDIVEIDGVLCTSLARTVIDIAMLESEEIAVTCADAAMRHHVLQWVGRGSGDAAADYAAEFRDRLDQRAGQRTRRRGIKQARQVLRFATWLSESPGESLSRLRMDQIGLQPPELQVEVPGPGGTRYRLDFLLRGKGIFGEFDGLAKYAEDPALVRRQVLQEKQRQEWIQSTTGWRGARWYWKDIATVARFESFARREGLLK